MGGEPLHEFNQNVLLRRENRIKEVRIQVISPEFERSETVHQGKGKAEKLGKEAMRDVIAETKQAVVC